MTQRYDTKKCAPGEPGPVGYEKYYTAPNGITLWRKDLIYGKAKRRKATDDSPASVIETTDDSPKEE